MIPASTATAQASTSKTLGMLCGVLNRHVAVTWHVFTTASQHIVSMEKLAQNSRGRIKEGIFRTQPSKNERLLQIVYYFSFQLFSWAKSGYVGPEYPSLYTNSRYLCFLLDSNRNKHLSLFQRKHSCWCIGYILLPWSFSAPPGWICLMPPYCPLEFSLTRCSQKFKIRVLRILGCPLAPGIVNFLFPSGILNASLSFEICHVEIFSLWRF